jgi:hypothetical protein
MTIQVETSYLPVLSALRVEGVRGARFRQRPGEGQIRVPRIYRVPPRSVATAGPGYPMDDTKRLGSAIGLIIDVYA